MKTKSVLLGASLAMVLSVCSVQSAERFATLGDVPAVIMSSTETAAIRGSHHIWDPGVPNGDGVGLHNTLGVIDENSPAIGELAKDDSVGGGFGQGLLIAGSGGPTGCSCGNDITAIITIAIPNLPQ